MLTREQVRGVREMIHHLGAPALSVYLDVHPARLENAGGAGLLRAKEALRALEVPPALAQRVLAALAEPPEGRTRVLLAGEGFLERWDLPIDLPLVEGLEARWGEPYLAPLLYALDAHERFGVVYLGPGKARLFEVFLGEITELAGAFQSLEPREWRTMTADSVGRRYSAGGVMAARGGADTDGFARRLEAWEARFFTRLAHEVEEWGEVRGLTRFVLVGSARAVEAFAGSLPRALAERVAGKVVEPLSLPKSRATAARVLQAVTRLIDEFEDWREEALVDEVVEHGVGGVEQVLQLLQEGRLRLVVAPWRLETTVYAGPGGWVSPSREQVLARLPGQPVRVMPLKDVLPELAASRGTRLSFVRGEAGARLSEQLGGLGGLERY
ncbi:VLRF1 family aeRF1-type release factor [Calidithermus chliarophilus]|uniref:VLRF1 family aeRF1-type release factor n=1 Tax=Calidithermus chliarophilus TaxID=52023 RepID=UPI000406C882|nr:VLRF1 family aeRF1-type release factor [Calidithermus chliarophilus]